jgi:hypothetical protein
MIWKTIGVGQVHLHARDTAPFPRQKFKASTWSFSPQHHRDCLQIHAVLTSSTAATRHPSRPPCRTRFDEVDQSRGHRLLPLLFRHASLVLNRTTHCPLHTVPRFLSSGVHALGCSMTSSSACTFPGKITTLEPPGMVSMGAATVSPGVLQ